MLPGGWVEIDALLAGCASDGFPVSAAELDEVVATSDKQRFAIDPSGLLVRANQGHSTAVDLQLEAVSPPAVLYHGTPAGCVGAILAEVVRDSVEITRGRWRNDADRRNITTRIAVNVEGNPAAVGNASELREVFTNLILNAVDAMPQGGKIELTCRQCGDKVRAIVRDDGVGMTDEIRKHPKHHCQHTHDDKHAAEDQGLYVAAAIAKREKIQKASNGNEPDQREQGPDRRKYA